MRRGITDPYEVLGLERGATDAEVRAAYLRLAKKHHPDKKAQDKASEWIFKEVQRAYETLRDANGVRSAEREHPTRAQEDNARTQAEDVRHRWEHARAKHTARGDGGTEPVCDDCGSVARWWSRLPRIVRLSCAWTKWTLLVGFLGLLFSICLLTAVVILWGGVWGLTLVVSLLLIGRPTMIMEPLYDVFGVLAVVLGS